MILSLSIFYHLFNKYSLKSGDIICYKFKEINIKNSNATYWDKIQHNLILLRQKKNWSVDELSRYTGISANILTDIENGEDFSLHCLFDLCALYGIPVRDIVFPLE